MLICTSLPSIPRSLTGDLAEFVYAVLSVGSTSAPGLIRAAVKDAQLHPVKKLLFFKFSDQLIRDEVAA